MGVYIKGMEMPKKCYGCFGEYHPVNLLSGTCKLTGESTDGYAYKCREDCPLVEVKEPHGDLIDVEEFKDYLIEGTKEHDHLIPPQLRPSVEASLSGFIQDIDEQPIVLEGE